MPLTTFTKRVKLEFAGSFSESITDAWWLNPSLLPAGFWSNVRSDGGDCRIVPVNEVQILGSGKYRYATHFYLYYGNGSLTAPAVTDPEGRNAVFQDYSMFLGMAEDPAGSAPQLKDWTVAGKDGTLADAGGGAAVNHVAGKLDKAYDFGNNRYSNHGKFDIGSNDICMGGWAKWSSTSSRGIFGAPAARGTNRYAILQQATGNLILFSFSTNVDYGAASSIAYNDGLWHYLVMIVKRGQPTRGYIDGSLVATSASNTNATAITGTNNPNWLLAHYNNASGDPVQADIDLEGAIGGNWFRNGSIITPEHVSLQYANQANNGTFWTIGSEETGTYDLTGVTQAPIYVPQETFDTGTETGSIWFRGDSPGEEFEGLSGMAMHYEPIGAFQGMSMHYDPIASFQGMAMHYELLGQTKIIRRRIFKKP